MAMITVRVTDQEKEWLQHMADFYGTNLSDLMKTYSMEQLEDEYDLQSAQAAHKRWVAQGKPSLSMEVVYDDVLGKELPKNDL